MSNEFQTFSKKTLGKWNKEHKLIIKTISKYNKTDGLMFTRHKNITCRKNKYDYFTIITILKIKIVLYI